MTVVLDASVIIKWLLNDPRREAGTETAIRLIESVVTGAEPVLQPPHWLAEVAAVLARLSPGTAVEDVMMLEGLSLPIAEDPRILQRACELAIALNQHVFDTMYHAIALVTPNAVLVTADERYFRAARALGRIANLTEWHPASGPSKAR